ncbi:unnamed protein product [Gongylonema pulchrum]|uniref:RIH_assoc domain-containing protein n=1 Tax=Gongylonema pulchrum TaxID=637853 RepID=A0A183D8K4_9BILA|nr:unnamed protein product [Gongylonema pulchrum]
MRTKHSALHCLRTLCDFDGTDITGAIFLSHMDARIISLVVRTLQQISVPFDRLSGVPADAPEYVEVLRSMLNIMSVGDGCCALLAVFAFQNNFKHLLQTFNAKKLVPSSEMHGEDECKTRFRQTANYGYLCEILFSLARNQSNGTFWRTGGPAINKLIDSNLISAATSLKQWLEPCREEMALGTSISNVIFLVSRFEIVTNQQTFYAFFEIKC